MQMALMLHFPTPAILRYSLFGILLFLFQPHHAAHAQRINEWIVSHSGGFTGQYMMQNIDADGDVYAAVGFSDREIITYLSENDGMTWREALRLPKYSVDSLFNPLPYPWHQQYFQSVARPSADVILVLGVREMKSDGKWYPFLYRSNDGGANWEVREPGDSAVPHFKNYIHMHDELRGVLLAGRLPTLNNASPSALYFTTDGGKTWSERRLPYDGSASLLRALQMLDSNVTVCSANDSVYWSTDAGNSWTVAGVLPEHCHRASFLTQTAGWTCGGIPLGTDGRKRDVIYRTADGGQTWTLLLDTLSDPAFGLNDVSFCDTTTGVAVGQWGKILMTTDAGLTWETQVPPYALYDPTVSRVACISPQSAVALSMSRIVTFTGKQTLLPPSPSWAQRDGELIYDIYWERITGADAYQLQAAEDEPSIYMEHWLFDSQGILDTVITSPQLALNHQLKSDHDYFVRVRALGSSDTSDWSPPIKFRTPVTSRVYGAPSAIPLQISAIYPNPVHTEAMIDFTLPSQAHVRLTVYDMSGRRTALLMDKTMNAGRHSVRWNAHNFPPGVYSCQLLTAQWSAQRRILLLR